MVDWSHLPYDLVVLIANQLIEIQDFLSFSAVCRSWCSIYLNNHWVPCRRPTWLMLGEFIEHDVLKMKFLSLSSFKWYYLTLPEVCGCQWWGTCHGFIVTFDLSFTLRLVNPIRRLCVDFPPPSMLRRRTYAPDDWLTAIQKAFVFKLCGILITFVLYTHNRSLAFCRHGDAKWTIVHFSLPVSIADVVCFKNQILAVTMVGSLMVIEIDGIETPRALFAASPPQDEKQWSNVYLAESSDNLLLVFRHIQRFKVYKLDVLKRKWNKVDDLGNRFLLVGGGRCASGSAYGYFKSNCIYYATDNFDSLMNQHNLQQKMTVYNVTNDSAEDFRINDTLPYRYRCPVWMTPFW